MIVFKKQLPSINTLFFFGIFSLLVICFFGSCVKDDNCKDCRIEVYEDGVLVEQGAWKEYCDESLREIQGQTSTVGNRTSRVVCR